MITWGFQFDESWCFSGTGDRDLEKTILSLAEAGYRFFEVMAPDCPSFAFEERIRELACKAGLQVSVHARFVGVNLAQVHPLLQEGVVQVAREDLAFAERIGAWRIIFHAGSVNWYDVVPLGHPYHTFFAKRLEVLRLEYMRAACAVLAELVEFASPTLQVFFENLYMPWEFPITPEEVGAFRSTLGNEVGFALDTGHACLAGYNPRDFFPFCPQHVHLHVNDGCYDLHLPPGPEDDLIKDILAYPLPCAVLVEIPPTLYREHLVALLQGIQSKEPFLCSLGEP